jgi:hypothetical protein
VRTAARARASNLDKENTFHTLLFRDGEGFRREDISEEAWANRNENIEPFSFWRSKWGSSSNRVKIYCSVLYATLLCPLVTDY